MPNMIQYLTDGSNCVEVADFLGGHEPKHRRNEYCGKVAMRVKMITIRPGQWALKNDLGEITIHDECPA